MWHGYCKATSYMLDKRFVTQQFKWFKADDLSPLDVKEAVNDLKKGKSAGLDNLTCEHFKYASNNLMVLLSIVRNCMIVIDCSYPRLLTHC